MPRLNRLIGAVLLSLTLSTACYATDEVKKSPDHKTEKSVTDASTKVSLAPAAGITTDANYTLRAGDNLHISVWKEDEMDRIVLILPDGTIDFPLIGSVKAAGLTPAALKDTITEKLLPFIPAATVSVVVKDTAGNTVSVIGQVAHPGDIVMAHELSVMQALSQAGGPTPYADESDIKILRKVDGRQVSLSFDYSMIARGKHLDENINLQPGDVVVVPTASLF